MARTGLEWPRSSRGAEGGVERARPCPALRSKISRRAVVVDVAAGLAFFAVRIAMSDAHEMQPDPLR